MPQMLPSKNKDYPISWHELHRDARALAWRLLAMDETFNTVVAITRGGLVPAAIVARELDIRVIDTICVSSYDHQDLRMPKILKSIDNDGEGFLIIDDLTDTGGTAKLVREILPKAHFATVYAKPDGKPYVDSYVTEISQDTWLFFPWDVELAYQKPFSEK